MKPNELRIGNYVMYADVICKVEGYSDGLLQTDGVYSFVSKFEPIKLSEDWLLKFGFINGKELSDMKIFYHTIFAVTLGGDFGVCVDGEFMMMPIKIRYVHELQNVFFALYGKELEYKIITSYETKRNN